MFALIPIKPSQFWINRRSDDCHENGLATTMPTKVNQIRFVGEDAIEKQLHIRLIKGPLRNVDHVGTFDSLLFAFDMVVQKVKIVVVIFQDVGQEFVYYSQWNNAAFETDHTSELVGKLFELLKL